MGLSSFLGRTQLRFAARIIPVIAILAGVSWGGQAVAHDFWIQPNEFRLTPNVEMPLTLQVGHGPDRQRSAIPLKRITRFEAMAPDGTGTDLRTSLHLGGTSQDGSLQFPSPGVYVLVFETDDRAQSFLPAIRFNDYLNVEGLTPALEIRARTHRSNADGSENYSRLAKSIVEVGLPGSSSQEQVTKPSGLTLEIVPTVSPYILPRPAVFPVRVIFEGRPLAGALVKLTNLDHDEAPLETHLTDGKGLARFTMPKNGKWLLNVIWTKLQPSTRDTDFETYFSSLSFGWRESQ